MGLMRLFGKDESFPPWVESLVGFLSFAPSLASCELKAFEKQNAASMMECPLKLGSQGLEMMHVLPRYFGIGKDFGESGVEKKTERTFKRGRLFDPPQEHRWFPQPDVQSLASGPS